MQIDEPNIDELFHALLLTFNDSDKPCDFIVAVGYFKSLIQGVTVADIILKCKKFVAKIRESYRNGTNWRHSNYPSSVTFVPLPAPPLLGYQGPIEDMTDSQYNFMQNISNLSNHLAHLNRLHLHCGEYMDVDRMMNLEQWDSRDDGNGRSYRDSNWETRVSSHSCSQHSRNLENTGSNKRARHILILAIGRILSLLGQ